MIILPAIDIKDGNCVRLQKGVYSTAQKVADSPYETAKGFAEAGAEWMHMVDLDGAKDAKLINADLIADVAKTSGLKVEVGGGIRSMEAVDYYLSRGINRVILGSAAVKNPQLVIDAVRSYGDKIAVGIDARDGFVQTKGWVETTKVKATELAAAVAKAGVKTIIYTDTATDGMLGGPNLTQMAAICDAAPTCQITASGGVSSPFDIENLKALERPNLRAAIVGKALYDGRTTLKEIKRAAL